MKRGVTPRLVVIAGSLYACVSSLQGAPGALRYSSPSSQTMRLSMRELWTDQVVWTRQYIVAVVAGDPSASVALARLMRNQDDIGNVVKPLYGDAAGAKLTQLLKQHVAIASELSAAVKAGDAGTQASANKRWHDNAGDIASFLAGANPNWSRPSLEAMLNRHLALTKQETLDRLRQNWTADQVTFDTILGQAMEMADALANGIIKQFALRA
jgi:hypothetical protein